MGAQENSLLTPSVLHRTPQSNAEDSEAKQIPLAFLLALTICPMIVMVTASLQPEEHSKSADSSVFTVHGKSAPADTGAHGKAKIIHKERFLF